MQSPEKSKRWPFMIAVIVISTVCVFCCGGPTLVYVVITKTIAARRDAPATPEPLTAKELMKWFRSNHPKEPFVWHDKTRDKVDIRGTVKELNVGADLRKASQADKNRTRIKDLEPRFQAMYKGWGKAQLVLHGEQNNQDIICWFEEVALLDGILVGQEIVVRGRKGTIFYPEIKITKHGGIEKDGGFSMNLMRCRVVSN